MARNLVNYTKNNSLYYSKEFHAPILFQDEKIDPGQLSDFYEVYGAGASYETFKALTSVVRPVEEAGWQMFSSSRKIAWKTGTSFGYRDAWAVGITPEYVVGVWVGNATGEGRPGIVGGMTAGPIMFDIFRHLPPTSWFQPPYDDMIKTTICKESGYKAGPYCKADTAYIPSQGSKGKLCPYHQLIHLDETKHFRVQSACYPISQMKHEKWFSLPPVMEWYYRRKHPLYKPIPPLHPSCADTEDRVMEFIYPQNTNKLYLPIGMDGKVQAVVLKVAHHHSNATIYWHMDHEFLGETSFVHQMTIQPTVGKHRITLIDEQGNILQKNIYCAGRSDE
ncbi:penicillin-binding protein 1C [Saccharicrinis fermentans]|uniref:Penicillin-binding protein 1C n=2 Tax=Saccharicrinis fermentans TaxID=982 RepID=W7Y3F5_9BACT|nr:hypothetical protein [Saccharicrinis fermentans]GAF05390.1 penicillin-binding protein 1C [Saccharicrinis fermentans DSM 9555 = JCM 21142]